MKGWNSKTLLTCFTDFRRLGAQWIHHFSRRKTISPACALFVPRVAHEILTGKKWKIQHITGTYFVYTIQDILSKLGMKHHFLLYPDAIRPTKIIKRANKKLRTFLENMYINCFAIQKIQNISITKVTVQVKSPVHLDLENDSILLL